MLTVQASDGRLFVLDKATVLASTLLRNLIQDTACGDGTHPIPLANIDGATMARVVQYCRHHYGGEGAEDAVAVPDILQDKGIVEPWDMEFMKMPDDELLVLVSAADYLNIESLVDLCCMMLAAELEQLPMEAIRERFDIADDLSDEQRASVAEQAKRFL
ncbi:suppressor of kinetochore protein mutant [Coemansia sp. Benny D115]|nr:suppressor of kinetochore protein mutant [Coemansia sp. Benny D115]